MQQFEEIMGRIVGKALREQAENLGDAMGNHLCNKMLSEGGFFILVDGYDFAVSVFFYSSIAVGTVVISVRISIVCPAFFVVA